MARCNCGRDAGVGHFQCPVCRMSNRLNEANALLKKLEEEATSSTRMQKEINEYFAKYEGKL